MGISYPPPKVAGSTPTCQVCGQVIYCGGPACPSISLPTGYDNVPQISAAYISVATLNPITGKLIPQVL